MRAHNQANQTELVYDAETTALWLLFLGLDTGQKHDPRIKVQERFTKAPTDIPTSHGI